MEKIKNLMHPGKSKDDEVMYGSGQSDDPVHAGTGSQATSSHNTNNPLSSSTNPMGNTTRDPVGQGGTGSVQQGSNPASSSHMPETHDTLNTNKALPREPIPGDTQNYGSSNTTGAGPHSSGLANKADPRVDSDLDSSGALGRGGAAGTTGGLTGNSYPDRTGGNTGDTTASQGRSFPLGGTAAAGSTSSGPHESSLANKADPRVDSDRDGAGGLSNTSGFGTGTGATVGSTHQGDLSRFGMGGTTGGVGESRPVGYSEKTWGHDHNQHGHDYVGDPCENESPAPGALHFTSGPHSLDTANRLDPHVSGSNIGLESTSASHTSASTTGYPQSGSATTALGAGAGAAGVGAYESSRGAPSSSTTGIGHHHSGTDAPLGAGQSTTGAGGVGGYEASRDMPSGSTSQHNTTTAGPHSSDMMNKLDPRVDSDRSKQSMTSGATGTSGVGSSSTLDPSTSREHHPGRDTALAGAGGAAAYEGAKHRGRDTSEPIASSGHGTRERDIPQGTSTSGYANPYPPGATSTGVSSGLTSSTTDPTASTDPRATGKDHHYGQDAGLVGAGAGLGAGAAYEADKHLGRSHEDTTGMRKTDPLSNQQPRSGVSGHEYGGDTGLTGAGATSHHEPRHGPTSTSGVPTQPSTLDEQNRTRGSHTGRDAALGAGTGAAAAAGASEYSKKEAEQAHKDQLKEAEHAHKEQLKEQKAAHKQDEKDAKHHQHEVEKAEKKHQHDLEKAEKAHEKKLEKEEAKHHKEEPQEGEKKHHGLLGLFHREKPDKELKEDEVLRKERLEQEAHPGVGTAAGGVGGATAGTEGLSEMEKHERAKEHDRNRLHKDPPPGYADPPSKGYASQVTGGTGTTALAQGDPVPSGSHATGLGNTTDPSITGRGETIDPDSTRDSKDRVIEPHTGLPMNAAKGDGAGGTDNTPVHGYHSGQTTGASGSGGEGFGHFQDHAR